MLSHLLRGQVLRTESRQLRLLFLLLVAWHIAAHSTSRLFGAVHLLVAVVANFTFVHRLYVAIKIASYEVRMHPVTGSGCRVLWQALQSSETLAKRSMCYAFDLITLRHDGTRS